MTVVRIKGIKRYRRKGRWYAYHRKSGIRINAPFGTAAFFAELTAIERKLAGQTALPGTLGPLLASYRSSPSFSDLAAATRDGYTRMINLLKPIHDMPVVELTPQFVAGMRDRLASKHGRRQANYAMSVLSVACEHAKEHGVLSVNPVKGVRRLRRDRTLPSANRPWSREERLTVLESVPAQLRVPIALAMFSGLRKTDALTLSKSAIRNGRIWRRTSKTGNEISIPLHPDLKKILEVAGSHDAITIATTTNRTPWTISGFNSTFIKAIRKLEKAGLVEEGLTFHGLRHTCGTLLVEAGFDIDSVRRWLGQKTLAMAVRYTETADTSARMRKMMKKFDPLGRKK